MLALFLMSVAGPEQVKQSYSPTAENPQTQVESPVIVERKNGKVVWQLKAAEANQELNGKMQLVRPVLTLFTQSGKDIIIKSERAWFDLIKRDLSFQDSVTVFYQNWQLDCQLMSYQSSEDILHIPEAFTIRGETISAKGKNMRLFRNSEQINVDGGIWIRDSAPKWQGVK